MHEEHALHLTECYTMAKSKKMKSPMIQLAPPDDRDWLAAYGKVAAHSALLDLVMSMTIKVITEVSVEDALRATMRTPSSVLRERVRKLAKDRLGDGPAFIELEAILCLARAVSEERNNLIHSTFVRDEAGNLIIQDPVRGNLPLPSVKELETLASQIEHVHGMLNHSRSKGSLRAALDKRPKKR